MSLEPLASEQELFDLERIQKLSVEITALLTKAYNGIARGAFGQEQSKGVVR